MNEDIENCLEVLNKGGTILYPTDTVWGIGCDASNEAAVQRIFEIKQRHEAKSMIVLVAAAESIGQYAFFPPGAEGLLRAPKPITVIYPHANRTALAPSVIASDGTIAIRVTGDGFCRELILKFGKPIVSTSANISGSKAPGNFTEIAQAIKSRVDYVVKWRREETNKNAPSGIIKINANGSMEVIRA